MRRAMRASWVVGLAWAAVLVITSVAIAGVVASVEEPVDPPVPVVSEEPVAPVVDGTADEVEEPEVADETDSEAVDVETDEDEASVENHGHCVSYWVHAAKAAGLKGSAKGAFVSSIARDPGAVALKDEPGESCDFQAALDEAVAAQGSSDEVNPASTKSHGKPLKASKHQEADAEA